MHWNALLVIAALVAAAEALPAHDGAPTGGAAASICDPSTPCKCNAAVITCQCTPSFQTLTVEVGSIPEANQQTLEKFEAKDCKSLFLLQGAFSFAHSLHMLHVTNVQNVTFKAGVIEDLHTLMIDSVVSLKLEKGTFEKARGLNNIVIRKTTIPKVAKGALYNILNIQEFKLSEVHIGKIEKEAILIDMKPLGTKAEILQCKIENIEEMGLQIGNGTDFTMNNTEIEKAETNSIRISSKHLMSLNGNTFHKDVHVNASSILFNTSIHFTKNVLWNTDINYALNMEEMPHFEPAYTLGRLSTLFGGNSVVCKCESPVTNLTEKFKDNICIGGCSEATVTSFLQSCQVSNRETPEERLKVLCKDSRDSTTVLPPRRPPTVTPLTGHNLTTSTPNTASEGKTFTHVLPLLAVYLFNLIL